MNCPNPSAKTAPTDPTYLGTFTFFGDDHDHADHGGAAAPGGADAAGGATTYVYNAAPLLQRLSKTEYAPDGDYKISLVAVPVGGGEAPAFNIQPKAVNLEAVTLKP